MSDLLECPVCGHTEIRERTGGNAHCQNRAKCGFYCLSEFWNQLPRTRWVGVDERLPSLGKLNRKFSVRYADDNGDSWTGAAFLIGPKDPFWSIDGDPAATVTHWLDGIPTPPGEK